MGINEFLRIFKHLLPTGRAWRITSEKNLRSFFNGLSGIGADIKLFFDLILFDFLPSTTRELEAWEYQFGIKSSGVTEAQRRARIDAAWKAQGGQSPRYIQDTLQGAGFDVYVYEWWIPGTEAPIGINAAATARNPLTYLNLGGIIAYLCEAGEPLAEAGEANATSGDSLTPAGYALVNIIYESFTSYMEAGEPLAEAGEPLAEAGDILGYSERRKEYTIPTDPQYFPYFLYIGGEVFGTNAMIDTKRRDEFEELCLKISPNQQWLGILVNYV